MNRKYKFDTHIHLAGTGCCNSGCIVSPRFRRRYTYRLLKILHGISRRQEENSIDRDWVEMIGQLIAGSEVDRAVVLGMDGVYDREKGHWLKETSQLIVPPAWVFRVCKNNKGLLPGPSINPYRKGALSLLENCIAQGAVLIKWLPAAQAIDPDDERLTEFYRIAARARLPILIHMGGERTFSEIAPDLNDVMKLRRPLEAGVSVICAHTATRIFMSSEPDQIDNLRGLLREFPHLWVDNSGLCNPGRFYHLPQLVQDELIVRRTLYGSDWPVPANAIFFLRQMGMKKVVQMEKIKNGSQRDIEIKRYFGYPDETLTRHSEVLANLDHWL